MEYTKAVDNRIKGLETDIKQLVHIIYMFADITFYDNQLYQDSKYNISEVFDKLETIKDKYNLD